jgi:predicted RNase H-like nuclease (RuvC/YqgF family)
MLYQAEIESLEKEIAVMERDLQTIQNNLYKATTEASVYASIVDSLKENRSLSTALAHEEQSAVTFERKCQTLRGAMKFKPSNL